MEDTDAKEHLMGFAGSIPPAAYEIVSPRVDLYGDVAIFTFNVDLTDPMGEAFTAWNTTQVHHRAGDDWELVHSHWSFATPPPEEPGVCREPSSGLSPGIPVDVGRVRPL